jgi:hypothetical protein
MCLNQGSYRIRTDRSELGDAERNEISDIDDSDIAHLTVVNVADVVEELLAEAFDLPKGLGRSKIGQSSRDEHVVANTFATCSHRRVDSVFIGAIHVGTLQTRSIPGILGLNLCQNQETYIDTKFRLVRRKEVNSKIAFGNPVIGVKIVSHRVASISREAIDKSLQENAYGILFGVGGRMGQRDKDANLHWLRLRVWPKRF